MERCAATPSTCDSAKPVDGLDQRGGAGRQRQRPEQVGAVLADHLVDQDLRGRRQHEAARAVRWS